MRKINRISFPFQPKDLNLREKSGRGAMRRKQNNKIVPINTGRLLASDINGLLEAARSSSKGSA